MDVRQFSSALLLLALVILISWLPANVSAQNGQIYLQKEDDSGTSALDTFSLSFVGNLNFARAVQTAGKVVDGVASCKFKLIQSSSINYLITQYSRGYEDDRRLCGFVGGQIRSNRRAVEFEFLERFRRKN